MASTSPKIKRMKFSTYIFIAFPCFYLWEQVETLFSYTQIYTTTNLASFPQLITTQSFIILGALLLTLVFILLAVNVSRKQIFTKKNYQIMSNLGGIIFLCAVVSTSLINRYQLKDIVEFPITLHISGAIYWFISLIFKIGIKMQEEQDLTI
ncbi:MAG: hypothetical protein BWZ00_01012 [Bacteroidetes bacterium ADurb.BinA174]|mgnify:CR=1 FL=1|nr:MAG: hypothetical protein BWZ00_01012 [Bacteroidetes bacterium ADurb.BinA174]